MVACPVIPAVERLRQNDHSEFEARLGYIVSPKPAYRHKTLFFQRRRHVTLSPNLNALKCPSGDLRASQAGDYYPRCSYSLLGKSRGIRQEAPDPVPVPASHQGFVRGSSFKERPRLNRRSRYIVFFQSVFIQHLLHSRFLNS